MLEKAAEAGIAVPAGSAGTFAQQVLDRVKDARARGLPVRGRRRLSGAVDAQGGG